MSEQRLIDANNVLQSAIPVRGEYDDSEIFYAVPTGYIKGSPTIDPVRHGYVLSSVHEQVQWERDIAIDQIHSYGVEFGEKAEIQRVRHGKWISIVKEHPFFPSKKVVDGYTCSECGRYEAEKEPYCNCGAKMDKE